MTTKKSTGNKLTTLEFTQNAIRKLRKPPYKGIHTVYSGFNAAFKEYFDDANPIEAVNKLEAEKKIVKRFVKGGVMIYLPDELPEAGPTALDKILG